MKSNGFDFVFIDEAATIKSSEFVNGDEEMSLKNIPKIYNHANSKEADISGEIKLYQDVVEKYSDDTFIPNSETNDTLSTALSFVSSNSNSLVCFLHQPNHGQDYILVYEKISNENKQVKSNVAKIIFDGRKLVATFNNGHSLCFAPDLTIEDVNKIEKNIKIYLAR